jgi:tight adherence protein B
MGLALGAGLVLMASPWLWPAARRRPRRGALDPVRDRLRQAGLGHVAPAVPLLLSVAVGIAAAGATLAVAPIPALALVAAAGGAAVPLIVLSARARSVRRLVRASWPDLVDHLVSGLRAGLPLAEAVGSLVVVAPAPVRAAFREFENVALGSGNVASALDRLKDSLADPVGDRVCETLRVAREVGGTELPSVLRALAASLRADAAVRSEAEARQSWVRGAARLGLVAPWAVLLLLASRPEAAATYNTPAGIGLLLAGLAVSVIAYRVMIALGRLPEERRWFA